MIMAYNVGDTVVLDGIESLIIYDAGSEQSWGRYLCADKNHDISYYLTGSDYKDESEPGYVINSANKYGYEWGGYGAKIGITSESIGSGLSNTNSLIGMNLQPNTAGWFVIWDKVNEFRSGRSDKWFAPSKDELNLIYENRGSLSGLTTIDRDILNPYYWSSSESSASAAHMQRLNTGDQRAAIKYTHYLRVRLCRYTTDSELSSTEITITDSKNNTIVFRGYSTGTSDGKLNDGESLTLNYQNNLLLPITASSSCLNTKWGIFVSEQDSWDVSYGGSVPEDIVGTCVGVVDSSQIINLNLNDFIGKKVVWGFLSDPNNALSVGTQKPFNQLDSTGNVIDGGELAGSFVPSLIDGSINIQITCTTPGASIYYTIDNSTPTSNSNLYTSTFQANIGTTIKAIGIKEGYIDSDIAEFTVS